MQRRRFVFMEKRNECPPPDKGEREDSLIIAPNSERRANSSAFNWVDGRGRLIYHCG